MASIHFCISFQYMFGMQNLVSAIHHLDIYLNTSFYIMLSLLYRLKKLRDLFTLRLPSNLLCIVKVISTNSCSEIQCIQKGSCGTLRTSCEISYFYRRR